MWRGRMDGWTNATITDRTWKERKWERKKGEQQQLLLYFGAPTHRKSFKAKWNIANDAVAHNFSHIDKSISKVPKKKIWTNNKKKKRIEIVNAAVNLHKFKMNTVKRMERRRKKSNDRISNGNQQNCQFAITSTEHSFGSHWCGCIWHMIHLKFIGRL